MIKSGMLLVGLAVLMSGCSQHEIKKELPPQAHKKEAQLAEKIGFLAELKNQFPEHFSLVALHDFVKKGQLNKASRYVNYCLKTAIENSALHLVNGLIYAELARLSIHPTGRELAGIAFRTAHTLNPSSWLPCYMYGTFHLESKSYEEAQLLLAKALTLKPNNPDVSYNLALASYYRGDFPVALASVEHLLRLKPEDALSQRAAAMIFAACGKKAQAHNSFVCYKQRRALEGLPDDTVMVAQRLEDWEKNHQLAKGYVKKAGLMDDEDEGGDETSENKGGKEGESLAKKPTIILSVYTIDLSERNSTNKGNSIFTPTGDSTQTLSVVLGGEASTVKTVKNALNSGTKTGDVSRTLKFDANVNSISYATNIASLGETSIQAISRPEVSACPGREAIFVESDRLTGTPPGGSSISVDSGIKLSCLVTDIAPDGCLTMKVEITGSIFGSSPSSDKGLTNQLISVSKSKASTTVKAYPGQTVMIAGMRSDEVKSSDSGFPFLKSLPLIQYFTSNASTSNTERSTLFLLSPKLGGTSLRKKHTRNLTKPTEAAKILANNDVINALGSYQPMYYIMRYLAASPMFLEFRSGDVMMPRWGYSGSSLKSQIDMLKKFLYF